MPFLVLQSADDRVGKYELLQEPELMPADDTKFYTDQHFGAPEARHQVQLAKPPRPISSFAHPVPELFTRLQTKRPDAAQRDAYAFAANDPDEAWSTLPARKKTRPKFAQLVSRVTLR